MPYSNDEIQKRKALQAILRAARVPHPQIDPPILRGLARLGVQTQPAIFFRFHHCVVIGVLAGAICGSMWGWVMWRGVWSQRNAFANITAVACFSIMMMAAFTLIPWISTLGLRKRLGLPARWEDWDPSTVTSKSPAAKIP